MKPGDIEALIAYLTEQRRHLIAQAKAAERFIEYLKERQSGTVARKEELRYNETVTSGTPEMTFRQD